MIRFLSRVEVVLLILFVFLVPTQLALHFWPSYAFVFGIRVDFLAPTLYFTDILVFCLVLFWIVLDRKSFWEVIFESKVFIFLFLALAVINTLFSTSPFLSFFKWVRLAEIGLVFLYFWRRARIVNDKLLFNSLFFSLITFSSVGVYQFIFGHTTGAFYFLGERSFNLGTPGIALTSVFGRSFLRAYSTFPHPNAMAGYFGAALIFLTLKKFFKPNLKSFAGLVIILLGLACTFSLGTLISILVCAVAFLFLGKPKLFKSLIFKIFWLAVFSSLILPLFSKGIFLSKFPMGAKVSQRIDLSFIAGKMVSERFLAGEGANTFIANIPGFKGIESYLWNLQPVHNIFLLSFAEAGILGLLALVFVFHEILRKLFMKKAILSLVFIFIVLTGIFDHYWLTIEQNMLLFSLLSGLALR